MKTIKLTQGFEAQVSDIDFAFLNDYSWHYHSSNCGARRGTGTNNYLHREIAKRMGLIGSIGFKDRNKLNCQRENLCVMTRGQMAALQGKRTTNTSGYKGVCRHKGKWAASIHFNGKRIYLGRFDSKIEAVQAYNKKAFELHGHSD